jgi:hypothetical protein
VWCCGQHQQAGRQRQSAHFFFDRKKKENAACGWPRARSTLFFLFTHTGSLSREAQLREGKKEGSKKK